VLPHSRRIGLLLLAIFWAITFAPLDAAAQVIPRPSDVEPKVPPPAPPEVPSIIDELPPVAPRTPLPGSATLRVELREIEVRGCTVFSEGEIAAITDSYLDRPVSTIELLELTQKITRLYVDAGYVSSGAVLPDQDLLEGRLVIQVIEGRVAEIVIEGSKYFREAFFRSRLRRATRTPVRVQDVTNELLILQRNRWIERVDSTLEPTAIIGESRLRIVVKEQIPVDVSLRVTNEYPSSLSQYGGGFEFTQGNVIGFGDEVSVWGEFTQGLRKVRLASEVPITPLDTKLRIEFQYSEGGVVESSLKELDIESQARLVNIELTQPLVRNASQELSVGIEGSWTRTRSTLLGDTFCLAEGVTDCEPTVSALRFVQEYTWRSRSAVFAGRSSLSIGLDVLGATQQHSSGDPDGEFVSWLTQLRWLQRLPSPKGWGDWFEGSLFSLRGDAQLSSQPLLSSEQIAVGGPYTVRAYRRNQLVRDNALIGSAQLLVPFWKTAFGRPILEIGPFFDVGYAWNDRGPNSVRTLSSVGLASRLDGPMGLSIEASWGYRIRRGLDRGDGLQRDGVYVQVVWDVF
jgi:hemolysin activation/secretion protein